MNDFEPEDYGAEELDEMAREDEEARAKRWEIIQDNNHRGNSGFSKG